MGIDKKTIAIVTSVASLLVIMISCLLFHIRRRKRARRIKAQVQIETIYQPPYPQTPVNHTNVAVAHEPSKISSQGEMFAVPLELLPVGFRYNSPGVEFKGDHVLVKDLSLVQIETKDEYQKQSPYNPNFGP